MIVLYSKNICIKKKTQLFVHYISFLFQRSRIFYFFNTVQELITTRQAAEILGVHESSIKRWCTDEKLPFMQTQGGHRRISLNELLFFATRKAISTPLHRFSGFACHVWRGLCHHKKAGRFDHLVELGYKWVVSNEHRLLLNLLLYLKEHRLSTPALLDHLIAPIMHRVGQAYQAGTLSIGDEHRITHCMRDILIQYQGHFGLSSLPSQDHSPTAVVGCARNQNHELGAIMARLVLEERGWQVIYMGANVPTEEFAQQQILYKASLICIALMAPMTETDVQHISKLLAHMYRPDQPYDLAFGGPLKVTPASSSSELPRHHFDAMESFDRWLAKKAA